MMINFKKIILKIDNFRIIIMIKRNLCSVTLYKKLNLMKFCFTFVEILVVLAIIGIISLPFAKMYLFGVQGSYENAEQIQAYNLAREKIEELKSLPFSHIKSDFEHFRYIYQNKQDFEKAFENQKDFEKVFTDVWTNEMIQQENAKEIFKDFSAKYTEIFRKEVFLYPEELKGFRRVVVVDERYDSQFPPRMKKVKVIVYDPKGHKQAELVTIVSQLE